MTTPPYKILEFNCGKIRVALEFLIRSMLDELHTTDPEILELVATELEALNHGHGKMARVGSHHVFCDVSFSIMTTQEELPLGKEAFKTLALLALKQRRQK